MRSISILGCGWLGLPLGKKMADSGYQVKGSTTKEDKFQRLRAANIHPYHLSFDPELMGNAEDFFDSEVLIVNLPPRNPDGKPDYHLRQLDAIRHLASEKVNHLIFISSTGVYPNKNRTVSEEDADPDCLSRGGVSLLKAEQVFSQSPDFTTTIIRFGGLYGPDRHPGRFFAGKSGLAGAQNPVNMIHLDDCIGVILTILDQDIWGETFNACSPVEKTRKSFYTEAAIELGLDPPIFNDEPAPFKKVSAEKLIRKTGYQFSH